MIKAPGKATKLNKVSFLFLPPYSYFVYLSPNSISLTLFHATFHLLDLHSTPSP